MEKLKKLLDRLLFPGTAVVVLSVPVAAALLAYTFLVAGEDSPIAYPSYVFSAYSLMIVCAGAVPFFRRESSGRCKTAMSGATSRTSPSRPASRCCRWRSICCTRG